MRCVLIKSLFAPEGGKKKSVALNVFIGYNISVERAKQHWKQALMFEKENFWITDFATKSELAN